MLVLRSFQTQRIVALVSALVGLAAWNPAARAEDWRDRLKNGKPSDSGLLTDADRPNTAVSSHDFQVSVGAFLPWMSRFATSTSGEPSLTSGILPTLGAAYRFNWQRFPGLSFAATGWVTPLGSALADEAGSSRWFSGALVAGLQERQSQFRLGTGFLMQLVQGAGGSVELDNGGGTSTFYRPSRLIAARVLYLDVGFAYQQGRLRYEIDALLTGLLSSRRSVGFVLQAGYALF